MVLPAREPKRETPFCELMSLERINGTTLRSTCRAFEPNVLRHNDKGALAPRAYGGHAYAQAVLAASKTVRDGMTVHSVSGYFILQARADLPFVYSVRTVRDGKSYCVRAVDATQLETEGVCFTCLCSFKTPDVGRDGARGLDWQEKVDIPSRFKEILNGRTPDELERTSMFGPAALLWGPRAEEKAPLFPGLVMQKADPDDYNIERRPADMRHLFYYRAIGDMPPASADSNLHAAAHLYASDRESLIVVAKHFLLSPAFMRGMASLHHTVVFHTPAEHLSMTDADGKAKWFCQEVWGDRLGDGRAVHHSRIWDAEGRHVATTMQDGMLRMGYDEEGLQDAMETLEEMDARSKL